MLSPPPPPPSCAQFDAGFDLFQSANFSLEGNVAFAHTYLDMHNIVVSVSSRRLGPRRDLIWPAQPNFTSTGEQGQTCIGLPRTLPLRCGRRP
jgi:hypothetical protein